MERNIQILKYFFWNYIVGINYILFQTSVKYNRSVNLKKYVSIIKWAADTLDLDPKFRRLPEGIQKDLNLKR